MILRFLLWENLLDLGVSKLMFFYSFSPYFFDDLFLLATLFSLFLVKIALTLYQLCPSCTLRPLKYFHCVVIIPSKFKYLQFRNIQNTIQHPFIAFADIESYIFFKHLTQNNKKRVNKIV